MTTAYLPLFPSLQSITLRTGLDRPSQRRATKDLKTGYQGLGGFPEHNGGHRYEGSGQPILGQRPPNSSASSKRFRSQQVSNPPTNNPRNSFHF